MNDRIAVTVAHSFFNPVTHNEQMSPGDCAYIVYDKNNQIVDRVPVAVILSRWASNDRFNDRATDIALIKLARAAKIHIQAFTLSTTRPLPGTAIQVIGFDIDMDKGNRRVLSEGRLYGNKGTFDARHPTVLIHDASTSPASSGAPLIIKKTGAVVGIHAGSLTADGQKDRSKFDSRRNYNRGVIFDRQFLREIDALLRQQ